MSYNGIGNKGCFFQVLSKLKVSERHYSQKEHHDFSMKGVNYSNNVVNRDYHITDDLLNMYKNGSLAIF